MNFCPNTKKCNLFVSSVKKNESKKIENFLEKTFPHMKLQIPLWGEYVKNNGNNIVIKNSKNEIKGFLNTEKMNDIGNVNFISIDPSLQGMGIGSKLLQYAEKELSGSKQLRLHTEGNKIQNMSFYLKNGWDIYSIDPMGYEHTTSVEFRKLSD